MSAFSALVSPSGIAEKSPDTPMQDTSENNEVDANGGPKQPSSDMKKYSGNTDDNLSYQSSELSEPPSLDSDPEARNNSSRKRNISHLDQPEKHVKIKQKAKPTVGEEGKIKLPFQSIISINLPQRDYSGPPQDGTYPYGDKESHMNSMLIYWLDECDKSYSEATALFASTFPESKAVEEAICRRHIRALQRLARKFGVKQVEEIKDFVGRNTVRRGKQWAPRLAKIVPQTNTVQFQANDAATSTLHESVTPSGNGTQDGPGVPNYVRKQGYKGIEKVAIVVWKDSEGIDYKEIRERLDEKYGWSLGRATVEKYYHLTRPKVYGAMAEPVVKDRNEELSTDGQNFQVGGESSEVEDLAESGAANEASSLKT